MHVIATGTNMGLFPLMSIRNSKRMTQPCVIFSLIFELGQVCRGKTKISLRNRAVWSQSSLSAWRCYRSLAIHSTHSEDSDQTAQADLCLRWLEMLFPDSFVLFPSYSLSVPNFRRHFVVCFSFLTNYRLEVKLKDWMSNNVDPDEILAVSSRSMLFAKACDYRLWQWKSYHH